MSRTSAPFREWASARFRFLLKTISRTRQKHIDAISCVQAASAPFPQIAQGVAPISFTVTHRQPLQTHESTDGCSFSDSKVALFKLPGSFATQDASLEAIFTAKLFDTRVAKSSKNEHYLATEALHGTGERLGTLQAIPYDDDFQFLDRLASKTTELHLPLDVNARLPLSQILDIAETAHKFGFPSFESWALSNISSQAMNPQGPLRNDSLDLCARMLDITIRTGHQTLSEVIVEALIQRLLDRLPSAASSSSPPSSLKESIGPILAISRSHGIHSLTSALLYHDLVTNDVRLLTTPLDGSKGDTPTTPYTPFLPSTSYLSAFRRLVYTWEYIRSHPPRLNCGDCDENKAWCRIWVKSAEAADRHCVRAGPADVISKLSYMDKAIRRALLAYPDIPLECSLAALEICTNVREKLVDELSDIFDVA